MLPILDLFIHRYLEMESEGVTLPPDGLEAILRSVGSLYKYHHQPVTFLYQTLYCYPQLTPLRKRKLATTIIQTFDHARPQYWALSEKYLSVTGKFKWLD